MPGRRSGKTDIRSGHWMTSAKANKSVSVWFIAQLCQSGQCESDPRPQLGSNEWKMRVSDPAHRPPTPSSPLFSPRFTSTCPHSRQNSISLTEASGGREQVGTVSSAPAHTIQRQLPSQFLSWQRKWTLTHTCAHKFRPWKEQMDIKSFHHLDLMVNRFRDMLQCSLSLNTFKSFISKTTP